MASPERIAVIPDFNDHGYLPPGIHPATMAEIEARFGREPELRRTQFQSLGWLLDLARQADIRRIAINGSYVTEVYEPNDVDCVLLAGPGYLRNKIAKMQLSAGLPFLQIDVVTRPEFDYMVQQVYATDRNLVCKGVVEIVEWN